MARMDSQTFEELATMLGTRAAGEVLLLAVARACGHTASLWNQAHSVGIPWQRKKWTALSTLQEEYNGGVETLLPVLLERGRTGGGQDNAEYRETCGGENGASSAACEGPYAPKSRTGHRSCAQAARG